ncbi:MAG: hypothetical protein JO219_05000 [Candidatus Eremiobacteraeota bacterium]|nr:hypothetical protein [Candidatus Eremiobacteraeota bacterium]MBV8366848.1 hypothetical protein [Candidatus Eremiobacteraeota bacterium]
MRQSTVQDYNPAKTASIFVAIAIVAIAAVLAIFAWHPWSPGATYDTTTNNVMQQQAPANGANPTSQPAPQSQPQPQST